MNSNYAATSPYYRTQTFGKGQFLDTWQGITIPPEPDDALYQIDPVYNLRPDLLAHDMYKNTAFWWVFAVRNPDVLTDPLMSFRTGTVIYVPTYKTLKNVLGL
jgi:hypothetical protein